MTRNRLIPLWLGLLMHVPHTAQASPLSTDAPPKGQSATIAAGRTIEFAYDGASERRYSWEARLFVPRELAFDEPAPILVFLHGINPDRARFRWMREGMEGDLRAIVSKLIAYGKLRPMLVAAPSVTEARAISEATTSWPSFDLDRFIERTEAAMSGSAVLDRSRIVVAGHSGGGCNERGGVISARDAKMTPHALFLIDSCMQLRVAELLGAAPNTMHVIASYQTLTWTSRPIADFRVLFDTTVKRNPPQNGVLRVLERLDPGKTHPHDAVVATTLEKWLPELFPVEYGPPRKP